MANVTNAQTCQKVIAHMLETLTAPNAGAFTANGTNTYIVGKDAVYIIDPGPDDAAHIAAIVNKTLHRNVLGIIITHRHGDHFRALPHLLTHIDAPVLAAPFIPAHITALPSLAQKCVAHFAAERPPHQSDPLGNNVKALTHGQTLGTDTLKLKIHHTPGHAADHIALELMDQNTPCALLSGDHIMGWSSTMISPPEGDMRAYLESLERCTHFEGIPFYPGHGDCIPDGAHRARVLIRHRRAREAAILRNIRQGVTHIKDLTHLIYPDLPKASQRGAIGTIISHLVKLEQDGALSSQTIETAPLFKS